MLTLSFFLVVSLFGVYVCEAKFGSKGDGITSLLSYGTHGGLHPTNQDGKVNVNKHKLEIFFDDDCDLEEERVFEYYLSLIEAFSDCLGNNTNYTQNIFSTPSGHWYGYIELLREECEDEVDIVYSEYCIADFEYEPIIEYRSNCASDSCTMPSGYTPGSSAPNSECMWHLDYIDGTQDSQYNDHIIGSSSNVDIYIIDTGVLSTHNEFSGRVTWLDNGHHDSDSDISHWHGTHCAGIAGGDTSGVSRNAQIFSVKTCYSCGSQGADSAMQAIISNMESRNRRSVVSMSWGWSFSSSDFTKYNDYFDTMKSLGGVMFAASTNTYTEHTTPCSSNGKDGPGGCDSVITISNYMSNWQLNSAGYGACVDLAGPGTSVTSAVSSCNSCYDEATGTSMATPAIAGFVVNMLNYDNTLTQTQIVNILSDSSASTPIYTNAGNLPGVNADCNTIKNLIDNYDSDDYGDDDDDDDDDDNDDDDDDNNNGFECDDGCIITSSYVNDAWCDCENCEDEDTCACPNGDCNLGFCGDYVSASCGYWNDDGLYVCADGCVVAYSSWYDDGWCDCSQCEDEPSCVCPSSGCDSNCDAYVSGDCTNRHLTGGDTERSSSGSSSSGSSGSSSLSSQTIIYICLAVFTTLALCLCIGIVYIMRKRKNNNNNKQMVGYNDKQEEDLTPYSLMNA